MKLIFTDQGGDRINNWLGLNWSHVLIQLNGTIYEATWPRVKTGPAIGYKYNHTRQYILELNYPHWRTKAMIEFAESKIGTRYNFWGYFFPYFYNKTKGIYCSQYACQILRAGGINIPIGAGYTPDKLLKAMKVYNA
jgi:hypothetical protein